MPSGDELINESNLACGSVQGSDIFSRASMSMLRHNDDIFQRLLDRAERRVRARRYSSALAWCRLASSFAMTNATTCLRSKRLEEVIDRIAKHALPASRIRSSVPGARRKVLHVLTEASEIGGLTRLVARWIRRDCESVSSVVITRQNNVIESLATAVGASGGFAMALGDGDALERAARLRQLGDEVDIIVCHLQPDDPVVAAAFGRNYSGAPAAVFNHADHLFMVAPTRATLFVDFRSVGTTLTREARGYTPEVTHVLPLLVPSDASTAQRRDFRASLDIGPDAIVVLTVSRAVKYRDTPLSPKFSELAATILEKHAEVVICAVGPTPGEEPWLNLLSRYPGRLRVVGAVQDPQPYFDAADIYLDPYPFSSLTSLLEASASALPVLTYDGHQGFRRALGIADFVPTEVDRPATLDEFFARMAELVRNPEARRTSGDQARDTFLALTPEEPWLKKVREFYATLEERAAKGHFLGRAAPAKPDAHLVDYALAILAIEQRVPLPWTMRWLLPTFDDRERLQLRTRVLVARIARKMAGLLGTPPGIADGLLVPRSRALTDGRGGARHG